MQQVIELNEDLKYVDKALDEHGVEHINKGIKSLENKIHHMVSSIARSELRIVILMSLTVLILTVTGVATSYSTVQYHPNGHTITILTILYMGIGSAILIGFFLRFLLITLLIPSIPLISILQLVAILAKGYIDKGYIDNYIILLLIVACCLLILSLNINFYTFRMYKSAVAAFIDFSRTIESILSKISRIELGKLKTDMQNLVGSYEKIYSSEAYELIKYIEELARIRG